MQIKRDPQIGARWLLSFSDLVTLLLCFFVSMIGHVAQNPGLLMAAVPQSGVSAAGTTIAEVSPSAMQSNERITVRLPENLFEPGGTGLLESGSKLLKDQVISSETVIEEVLIRSCTGVLDTAAEQVRMLRTGRALAIVGQLIDAGIGRKKLSIELPTERCEGEQDPSSVEVLVTRSMVNRNG